MNKKIFRFENEKKGRRKFFARRKKRLSPPFRKISSLESGSDFTDISYEEITVVDSWCPVNYSREGSFALTNIATKSTNSQLSVQTTYDGT